MIIHWLEWFKFNLYNVRDQQIEFMNQKREWKKGNLNAAEQYSLRELYELYGLDARVTGDFWAA